MLRRDVLTFFSQNAPRDRENNVKQEQDAALVVMWCGDRARECDPAKPEMAELAALVRGAYYGCVIFSPLDARSS